MSCPICGGPTEIKATSSSSLDPMYVEYCLGRGYWWSCCWRVRIINTRGPIPSIL